MSKLTWVLVAAIIIILGVSFLGRKKGSPEDEYRPVINASDFSADINNPYFTLVPGTKFVYEAVKPEGKERIEITVLDETKMVFDVETRVVKDQVFLNGELIEDTLDWYAQDKEGNVWQFGDSYWQEFYKGEAEDRADVLALGESVTVPYGSFTDCLKTYDYTPLDPNAKEHKYYCKGVGFVTLEVSLENDERTELISVTK